MMTHNHVFLHGVQDNTVAEIRSCLSHISKLPWVIQVKEDNAQQYLYDTNVRVNSSCMLTGFLDYKRIYGQIRYLSAYAEIEVLDTTVVALGRKTYIDIRNDQELPVVQALSMKHLGFIDAWYRTINEIGIELHVRDFVEANVTSVHRPGTWLASPLILGKYTSMWPKAQAAAIMNMPYNMLTDALELMQSFLLVLLGGTVHCVGITSHEYILV